MIIYKLQLIIIKVTRPEPSNIFVYKLWFCINKNYLSLTMKENQQE